MSRAGFLTLHDWKLLRDEIEKAIEYHREACIEATGPNADLAFGVKEYERGWYDALRDVLAMPERILKEEGGEEPAPPEPEKPAEAIRSVPRMSKRF